MKPWGKVPSFRDANTVFERQQINGQTQRRDTLKTKTEERSKERTETQNKEDPSSRSKEEPGLLRDTTSEGPSTM
jgi:hypothetical protein